MPKFHITSPDGKQFEIEAPEGATQDQVLQFAQSSMGREPAKPYDGWGDYAKDLARTAGQGLTLGAGDEITAAVRAPFTDGGYDQALTEERQAVNRFREVNPGTALATELAAGMVLPGVGMAKVAMAPTAIGRIAQGAKYGAGFGGAAGFASGEGGVRNRLESAQDGAEFGAILGGGVPAVASAAGRGRTAAQTMAARAAGNEEGAALYVADKLRANGVTEADIASDLRRGQQAARGNDLNKDVTVPFVTDRFRRLISDPVLAKAEADAAKLAPQLRGGQEVAEKYFADRLRSAGVSEARITRELKEARLTFGLDARSAPETIADVAPVTQRILRGIKVGGEADDIVEPFLSRRQAGELDFSRGGESGGQFARINEHTRKALNISDETTADAVAKTTAKRSTDANKLFTTARQQSQPFDLSPTLTGYSFQAMQLPDPAQRAVLNRAVNLFSPVTNMRNGSVQFGVNDINRVHLAKQALDDLIGSAEVRDQGNLKRLLTKMKHEVLDTVFQPDAKGNPTRNVAYRDALDTYASQSELLNAADLGKAIANGTEQLTARMWKSLSIPEKNMVKRAWADSRRAKIGGKAAGPTTDYTSDLRTPNTANALRTILPPTAGTTPNFQGGNRERLAELVTRETRMSDTSRKVLGNSSTAEKAVDAIDAGKMVRSLRYIKDQGGIVNAAINGMADTLEKLSAIKGDRARYLAEQLLSTDRQQQMAFLRKVRDAHGRAAAKEMTAAVAKFQRMLATAAAGSGAQDRQAQRGGLFRLGAGQ